MKIPVKTQTQKPKSRQEQIAERLAQIPESCRKTYQKAVGGKNRPAAVKAFCQECVGYDKQEVTLCTDEGCSLWAYRPYRFSKGVNSKRFSAQESTDGVGSVKQAADSNLAQQRARGAAVSERTPAEAIAQQAVDKFLVQEARP